MISFINHSCQFYIFTLSSKLFRQELKKYFISIKHNLIQPQVPAPITMNNERITSLKLKEDLLAKETSLFQSQSIINELKKELEQTREQVIQFIF